MDVFRRQCVPVRGECGGDDLLVGVRANIERLAGSMPDQIWLSGAASFMGTWMVMMVATCIDPKIQWTKAGNIWYNAAIRIALHSAAWPLRQFRRLLVHEH